MIECSAEVESAGVGDLCDEPNVSLLTSPGDGATLPVFLLSSMFLL